MMRYQFIIYEDTMLGKKRRFEMLLIETYSDVVSVMSKVIAPSLMKFIFDDHTLREVRKIPGTDIIKAAPNQVFLDPVRIGNGVYIDLLERVSTKQQPVIMNKDGGYQPYNPNLLIEMGWKEIKREKRSTILFNKYD